MPCSMEGWACTSCITGVPVDVAAAVCVDPQLFDDGIDFIQLGVMVLHQRCRNGKAVTVMVPAAVGKKVKGGVVMLW